MTLPEPIMHGALAGIMPTLTCQPWTLPSEGISPWSRGNKACLQLPASQDESRKSKEVDSTREVTGKDLLAEMALS